MTHNLVTAAADDNCATAANTFREFRLKSLPVVQEQSRAEAGRMSPIAAVAGVRLKETQAAAEPNQPFR
jgi:hypothetical protein